MTIVNEANLDAVNTAFEDAANKIFSEGAPGQWQTFTTLRSHTGTSAELNLVDGIPQVREWLGSKRFKQLRAYKLNKTLRKWEASLRVAIDEINGDVTGVVAARLRDFVTRQATVYDKIMTDELLANPACYDGQNLLANSHPLSDDHPNATTYDNLSTSALGYAVFKTAAQTLEEMTDFEGEPLDVTPTHLMVGPAQTELAQQITGSDKLVGLGDDGELVAAGGSSIDSTSGMFKNYIGGSVMVIVNKRVTGNEWFLMDLSKGDMKPMYAAEFQAPRHDAKDRPEDDNVFYNDEALYSLTAKMTPMAMLPQLIYGSVTA